MWDEGEYEIFLAKCKRELGDLPRRSKDLPVLCMEAMVGYFAAMRLAYVNSLHTFVLDPIRKEFKTRCMQETLEDLAPMTFDDEVQKHLKISELYQYKWNRGVIRIPHDAPFAEEFRLSKRCADAIRPRINQVVEEIYSEMCVWVAGLKFDNPKGVMCFLNQFESHVDNQPVNVTVGWPTHMFATFRAEFLMRKDFHVTFPRVDPEMGGGGKLAFPHFSKRFPVETLISITYTDDEKAMRKWLQVAIKWLCEEDESCCMLDVLDHCVMNNAAKCIRCITGEIFDKHMRKSAMVAHHAEGVERFTGMLKDSLQLRRGTQTRNFGYVGSLRWDKMTPAFLKAVYCHPLAVASKLPKVPRAMPLHRLWVRTVRWAPVRAYVQARSAIVFMMRLVAERECRAEFADDGSALLLGDLSRGDRAAHAVYNGVNFKPLNHGKAPVARSATASFNLALQKSMELIEKSRLERAEARGEGGEGGEDGEGGEGGEGGQPSPKRARVEA